MKGILIPISGVTMFVITIVVISLIGTLDFSKHVSVLRENEATMSFLHQANLLKKSYEGSLYDIIKISEFETAQEGCGYTTWTQTSPSVTDCTDKLKDKISIKIDSVFIGTSEIAIVSAADSYTVSIDKNISIADTKVSAEGEIKSTTNTVIPSNLFTMVGSTRTFIDGVVDAASLVDITATTAQADLQADLNTDLNRVITINEFTFTAADAKLNLVVSVSYKETTNEIFTETGKLPLELKFDYQNLYTIT